MDHNKMLDNFKRQVKRVFEEAVTSKCISIESSSVKAAAYSIEFSLTYKLKFKKRYKWQAEAPIDQLLYELSRIDSNASEVLHNFLMANGHSSRSRTLTSAVYSRFRWSNNRTTKLYRTFTRSLPSLDIHQSWVQMALTQRKLCDIVQCLINNSQIFYDFDSIISDPTSSSIFINLLSGLEVLHFNNSNVFNFQSNLEPDAHELINRQKLGIGLISSDPRYENVKCRCRSYSLTEENSLRVSIAKEPRRAVDHLYNNDRSSILYAKNYVALMQENTNFMGYMFIERRLQSLQITWISNYAVLRSSFYHKLYNKGVYCKVNPSLITIDCSQIVALLCSFASAENLKEHRNTNKMAVITFICLSGIHYPPIGFSNCTDANKFLLALAKEMAPTYIFQPAVKCNEESDFNCLYHIISDQNSPSSDISMVTPNSIKSCSSYFSFDQISRT
ncbi:hypothetical protein GJ496_008880 [Pomphorhynchus laevis]|nr:hypothetical protein GJ496_008880 [Pomphorhynchus laevis]